MKSPAAPLLNVCDLDVDIAGKSIVRSLTLTLRPGETLAILGRNGTGKTTLLHTLAGVRASERGTVDLCGTPYRDQNVRQVARLRGLLPQAQADAFQSTVLETALIGRHPHVGRWAWESQDDGRIARAALAAVGLDGLEQREVHTLSGGERQRLAIATLLTQEPLLYLLDEPLAHLDLNHQIAMLELVSRYAAERHAGFVVVLHDVNLALRYCARTLLLFGDGRWQEGPAEEILTAATLSELYGHPLRELRDVADRYFIPI